MTSDIALAKDSGDPLSANLAIEGSSNSKALSSRVVTIGVPAAMPSSKILLNGSILEGTISMSERAMRSGTS